MIFSYSTIICISLSLVGVSFGKYLQTDDYHHHHHDTEDRMHKYRRSANKNDGSVRFEDADFWHTSAQAALAEKLKVQAIKAQAKNTIFFLGDGMSLPTITASRIYKGQLTPRLPFGEEGELFIESFPNIGLSKTFCADAQVADSACSATAYLCGVKANIATIGVKPSVVLADCAGMMNASHQVESVLAWAQAAGKSTGIVTTTRVTHASPAGTYAHIADRDWENDQVLKNDGADPDKCDDIAEQLILKNPGQKINVIFGGGRREFTPNTVRDPETNATGRRGDGKDLIEEWKRIKADEKAQYIWNRTEFEQLNTSDVDYVLGLFNYDHLDYTLDDDKTDPTLPELTKKAIEILSRNPNGYFLFVEGGRIDHAHHDGKAQKALMETVVMDRAVETAANMTSEEDTLILVTADHAHVMTIAGYPQRGNPILGVADVSDKDGLPYTTLSYANGPGYRKPDENGDRFNISGDNFFEKDYKQISTLPIGSETHGGDDVIIFSRGPFSHLLKGVVQQSYIPHVIGYANCYGPGLKYCTPPPK